MALLKSIAHLLDRSGGRGVLARLASAYARRRLGRDVRIVFDHGVWLHTCDGFTLADSHRFDHRFAPDMIDRWPALRDTLASHCRINWFHVYEPRAGDVIVDVGANDGSNTHMFADAVGPTGRVLAIEAHPRTFELLDAQVRWNKLAQVTPVHAAVTAQACEVYIEDQADHQSNAIRTTRSDDTLGVAVPGLPLDELCRQHNIDRIDFLKMNIEGAERQAVLGMDEVIARTRHICIACHDFKTAAGDDDSTRPVVIDYLRRHGFEVMTREDDPRAHIRDHVHGVKARAAEQ